MKAMAVTLNDGINPGVLFKGKKIHVLQKEFVSL